MNILNKKVYREIIRENKFRSIVIILTIALTVGFLFGLANTEGVIYASYDLNMEKLNTPEVRLHFQDLIDENNVTSLLANSTVLDAAGIKTGGIEGRLFLHGKINYKDKQYEALWISLNTTEGKTNQIDKLRTLKGKNYFDSNKNEVLVGYQFAQSIFGHNVKLNDKIELSLGNQVFQELTVVGTVQSNEFTYVVDDRTNVPTLGGMAVIYTSLEWTWEQLNQTNVINQMLIDTREMSEEAADHATSIVQKTLLSQGVQVWNYYSSWTTPDRLMFEADAGVLDNFAFVLGGFSLLIGIILVYNSLTKMINSQRTQIGLLGALGSKRKEILIHYTAIGTFLGVVGVFLGILLSFGLSYLLTLVMNSIYGFKYIQNIINPVLFIGGSLITLTAVIFFSMLACLPVLRITPREAMVSTFTRTGVKKKPFFERLLKFIPVLRSISSSIPLREISMNKKRSSLTIIAIAVSSIILTVSGALVVDMLYGVDQNYNVYEKYEGRVIFNEFKPQSQIIGDMSANISEIDQIEPFISIPLAVNFSNQFKGYTFLEVFQRNSSLRNFHIIEGNEPSQANEVLLGRALAEDWKIKVGDDIDVILFPTTPSINLKVVGFIGEFIDIEISTYLDLFNEHLINLNWDNYINGAVFTLEENAEFDAFEEKMYSQFSISYVENSKKTGEEIKKLFEVVMEFASVFMLAGVFMVTIFSFNTVYLAYLDREMEYLALRAQGMKRKSLIKIITIETFILGILGFLLAIPLTLYSVEWGFNYIAGNRWYIEVWIPVWFWFVIFILSIGSVMLATLIIAWRINRANMPNMLRNRQIG